MSNDETFEKFKECAVEVLQVPEDKITKDARFAEDLDADSLDLVELVMALDAIGLHERAHTLFEWVQFLRHDDGAYWCGMNFDGGRFDQAGEHYTPDHPTWNSAAVVLAAHALYGTGPTAGLFRGEGLPVGLTREELIAAGTEIEAERSARRHSR